MARPTLAKRSTAEPARPALAPRPQTSANKHQARLVDLQRLAGNKAVAVIAQRQPTDVTTPLLDTAQIAKAKKFYRAQPWLYPKNVINELRTKLGLAEGGIDDELVNTVAQFQTDNSADPNLKVDGMAGPRSYPRLFPAGLAKPGEGAKFGTEMQDVIDRWDTLATVEAREKAILEGVNKRLADAGVPPVKPPKDRTKSSPTEQGSFDFRSWGLVMEDRILKLPGLDTDGARELADTAFHEARHAEQWFAMARLRAGLGRSVAGIVADLQGIPTDVAAAAKKNPIKPGTTEAVSASGWYESVYGANSEKRNDVLTKVEKADFALTTAQCRAKLHPSAKADELVTQAQEKFDKAHDAYQDLPEENDAFATAGAAGIEGTLTHGTPNPQAIPEQDPCEQLKQAKKPIPGPA